MTWVKLVSLSQVSHRERWEEPTTTTNTGCSACVQGMPCSPFFHSPTAEQHRRMEMLIQLGRLWPRMVVERLHPLIPSSPTDPRTRPPRGPRERSYPPARRATPAASFSGFQLQGGEPGWRGTARPRPLGLRDPAAGTGSGEGRAEAPEH